MYIFSFSSLTKNFLFIMVAITGMLFLAGCAPTNMVSNSDCQDVRTIIPHPDKSTLVIYRSGLKGSPVDIKNYYNKTYIGSTAGFGYFLTQVQPGVHYITTKINNYNTTKMLLEPNKVYFLKNKIDLTFMVNAKATGALEVVDGEVAYKDLLDDCTFYQKDENIKHDDIDENIYKSLVENHEIWNNIPKDTEYLSLLARLNVKDNEKTLKYENTLTEEAVFSEVPLSKK